MVRENDRLKQWEMGSHAVADFGRSAVAAVQRLGELDSELIESEASVADEIARARDTGDPEALLTAEGDLARTGFQAHLWVLGAYELVRVLSLEMSSGTAGDELLSDLLGLKELFTRVRIPLAKFEPASTFKETDYPIADLVIDPTNRRIGWQVSPTKVVYRRELADRFLEWLLRAGGTGDRFPGHQQEDGNT